MRAFAAVAFLILARTASACASCKDALGSTSQGAALGKGFYLTILLMLGLIFSMVGFLIYKIVREARKSPPAV